MSKINNSLFSSPLMLGFDHFERLVDRLSKISSEGYPPYNIEQVGTHGFVITLALAGFELQNLEIELEDNQLTVRGLKPDDGEKNYIYRGIANRQFIKTFILAEGIQVVGAEFDSGLLHIHLLRPKSEANTRKIEIIDANKSQKSPKSLTCDIVYMLISLINNL